MRRVCVFCGSSPGARPEFGAAATLLGRILARRNCTLVYGAGNVGLMGTLADAALEAGGEVIGVIPEPLVAWEVAHRGLTRLEVVDSMHTRKARMAELADAFIALPGGLGTFEEMLEILTWAQLGLHRKPFGLLNVAGYYDPLLALLDRGVEERFLRPEHRAMVLWEHSDAELLLDRLATYVLPTVEKYLDRAEA
jgi:hypothetical protein